MHQIGGSVFKCTCNPQNLEQPAFHREPRESGGGRGKRGGEEADCLWPRRPGQHKASPSLTAGSQMSLVPTSDWGWGHAAWGPELQTSTPGSQERAEDTVCPAGERCFPSNSPSAQTHCALVNRHSNAHRPPPALGTSCRPGHTRSQAQSQGNQGHHRRD